MSTIVKKIQVGTAACAIAAASIFTPGAVAQAEPTVAPVPSAGLGSSVASPACDPANSDCAAPSSPNARSSLSVGGASTIFQNPLWWFGAPNPSAPPRTVIFQFYPLALLPAFVRPFFGWFEAINFEACVGGVTLHIGPYGAVSGSYGRGCA